MTVRKSEAKHAKISLRKFRLASRTGVGQIFPFGKMGSRKGAAAAKEKYYRQTG